MKELITGLFTSMMFFSTAQTIEKSNISSGGGSSINGNVDMLYTIGEVNVQELIENLEVSEGFINRSLKTTIQTKVFLQGPIITPNIFGLMNDDLRVENYLPLISPYSDYSSVEDSVFDEGGVLGNGDQNDNIVDWVWVEFRTAYDNTKRINGRSALLQRDGDIVDFDGVSPVQMQVEPNYYYVVVKHRNHLGVMTSEALDLTISSEVVIDFTDNLFSTFNTNAQTQMESGIMALWAGKLDSTGTIKFSGSESGTNVIKDYILADPNNVFNTVTFSSSGYLLIDLNLNGTAAFSGPENESNIIKDNVLAHPSNVFNSTTYFIQTTIPNND